MCKQKYLIPLVDPQMLQQQQYGGGYGAGGYGAGGYNGYNAGYAGGYPRY